MNSSLASPAVQLAKAHSGHNEVVRSDSQINSHSADQHHWCSTFHGMNGCLAHGATIWCDTWWWERKGANSKLTKARQSKGSNQPPQAVPQRRYMVVDGLGVARALAIMDERGRCQTSTWSSSSSPLLSGGGCLGKLCVNRVSSSIPICICILYLCLYLIVFVL